MFHLLLSQALAQAPDAPVAPTGGEGAAPAFGNPLFFIIIFIAIMYFMMIRPQQKREKQRREMLSSLNKGDKVVTSGGICGTGVGLSEKTVVLRVDDDANTKIEFVRGAISQITSRANESNNK